MATAEFLYHLCKECYVFVRAGEALPCLCNAPRAIFTESWMRAGIYACRCGYVGVVAHGCKDGDARLVAKISDVDPSVTVHTVADCTAAAKAAIATAVGRIRITHRPGSGSNPLVVCECRDVIHEERNGVDGVTLFTCGKCGLSQMFS